MRLRNRFLLIALGITIFSLMTPFLVLYARGFKFDLKTFQIIKTGSLVVETDPAKAKVFLNGELADDETPSTIRFLLPGDYQVSLRRDGFQEWNKRLGIRAQLATWANLNREFVTLFFNVPQVKNEITGITTFKTKSGNSVVYTKNSEMFILEDDAVRPRKLGAIPNIDITPLINKINYDGEGLFKIYNQLLSNTLPSAKFGQVNSIEANNRHVAVLLGRDLQILANNTLETKASGVETMDLNNNYIWFIQGNTLTRLNLNTNQADVIAAGLPAHTTSKIIHSDNYLFVLLDNALYRVNEKLEHIYSPVNYALWNHPSGQLVFANDNEVMIYHPLDNVSELVLRSLSPISSPVYNIETGYTFASQDGKIKAIEMDGRDHRNIFNLSDAAENFAVSNSGEILTVFGKDSIKIYQIR